MSDAATIPDLALVCCVEAGALESQTIRMVRSLREHGGRFANLEIVAVTPRFGPALAPRTLEFFRKYNVAYIRPQIESKYSWFNFLNKPLALFEAEKIIEAASVAWLDGDLLFVGEPSELELRPGEDFAGFPVESKEMGTTGPGDPYENLWRRSCEILEIDIEKLPFQITAQTNERIRLYFNGGIFVYRRASGFSSSYLNQCLKLLDSRIITEAKGFALGFKEMASIGFSVIGLELKWRALPYSHDYVMLSKTHSTWFTKAAFKDAKVLHYHDTMWPHFWDTFYECLSEAHPKTADWLSGFGPMKNEAGLYSRAVAFILRKMRKYRADQYLKEGVVV